MPHPQMFDDDDPLLATVRELALGFPGASEKVSHGRPAFFTNKVFAYYGGSIKVDGAYVQHPRSALVKPEPTERLALVEDPRCYVPAYLGASGWIGLDLDGTTDWTEVSELMEGSFRGTASRNLIGRLDARRATDD